jgi:phage shock protein A
LPVESGGKVVVAVAEESVQSMQESVQQLVKAVAQEVGAYEQQARLTQRVAQDDGAHLAMSRAISARPAHRLKQPKTPLRAGR